MSEAVLWILGAVGSGLIGLILAVIFDEPIRGLLRILFGRRAKPHPLAGLWRAEFEMYDGRVFVEIIRLRRRWGKVEGHISPHTANYPSLRAVDHKKPLRVQGDLSTGEIFTGFWFHPIETSRYHGTFQLKLRFHGSTIEGRWIGYSESQGQIKSGTWKWTRMDGSP